jgi:cell division transport system ATP-binding protein
MIKLNNVSKCYPGEQNALSDISLHLPKGSLTFLTGHSGAGKSTLLKMIALLERPSSGQVLIGGQNISRFKKSQIPYFRRRFGLVFQQPQLLYERSVFDNVALPLIVSGEVDYKTIGQRVRAALNKVQLLNKENALPVTLSDGERQRVGIARAIVARPQLILADEPTGNLDEELSAEIFELFQQFNQIGTTILIASHDKQLVSRFTSSQITLNHGRLVSHEVD